MTLLDNDGEVEGKDEAREGKRKRVLLVFC